MATIMVGVALKPAAWLMGSGVFAERTGISVSCPQVVTYRPQPNADLPRPSCPRPRERSRLPDTA